MREAALEAIGRVSVGYLSHLFGWGVVAYLACRIAFGLGQRNGMEMAKAVIDGLPARGDEQRPTAKFGYNGPPPAWLVKASPPPAPPIRKGRND